MPTAGLPVGQDRPSLAKKVLQYLAEKFEPGRQYPEKEVNDILKRFHTFGDWALLRRELFEAGKLGRDPKLGLYWRREALSSESVGD